MSNEVSLILKPRADLVRIDFRAFQDVAIEAESELAAVTSTYRQFHRSSKHLEELYSQKAFWVSVERLCLYRAVLSPYEAQDQLAPFLVEGLFGDPALVGRLLALIEDRGGDVPQLNPILVFLSRLRNSQQAILLDENAANQDHAKVMTRAIRHSLRKAVYETASVGLPWDSYLGAVEALCSFNDGGLEVAQQHIESARDRLKTNLRFRHIASTVARKLGASLIKSLGSRDRIENLLNQSLADKENVDARIDLSNYYWAAGDSASERTNAIGALATARTAWQRAVWEVTVADCETDPQRRVELLEEIRGRWSVDGAWTIMGDGVLVMALIGAYHCVGKCERLGHWVLLIADVKSSSKYYILLAKGSYLWWSGHLESSVEYFQKALEIAGNLGTKVDASLRLAYVFESLGRFEDALTTARNILALYPGFGAAEELVTRMRLRTMRKQLRRK